MVARDHEDPDARGLAGRYCRNRLGPGRIQHPLKAQKIKVSRHVTMLEMALIGLGLTHRKGEHPLAPARHGRHRLLDGATIERLGYTAVVALAAAAQQHRLHRTLDQDALTAMQGGHVLLLGGKGNRVLPGVPPQGVVTVDPRQLRCRQQGCLGGITHQSLAAALAGIVAEEAGQQGFTQGHIGRGTGRGLTGLTGLTGLIELTVGLWPQILDRPQAATGIDLLHRHAVLGEGAGFV